MTQAAKEKRRPCRATQHRPSDTEPERLADRVVVAFEVEGQNNLLLSEAPVDQLAETNDGDCKGIAARLQDPWTRSEVGRPRRIVANAGGGGDCGRRDLSHELVSSRIGENPLYGMNGGGKGNVRCWRNCEPDPPIERVEIGNPPP